MQGLKRGHDPQHLLLASTSGWILVTHDQDFALLHEAWLDWSTAWGVTPRHYGVLLLTQTMKPPRLAREIHTLLRGHPRLENRMYELLASGTWKRH